MRRLLGLVLVMLVVFAAGVGCKSKVELDKAAVRALVEKDSTHFRGSTAGDSSENVFGLDDTTEGLWWRGPQSHDPSPVIEVGVSGDSAWVGWHQHNYGELIHWVKTSDTTAVRWVKNLQEKVQINAIFMRDGKVSDTDRGWKLKKITLVEGTSETTNTVRIDSVHIHTSLQDVTIVDPLAHYFRLDSLVSFTPGEQVTITMYTNVEDGFANLHAFWLIFFIRLPFQNMGNGVYSGTWNAELVPGFRFAIFELLSRGTLLKPPETGPYDYKGWLFPYMIKTAD
ncbi:MAG: hypothetical protein ABIL25_01145 [candidate division WOR-3 bacterium]